MRKMDKKRDNDVRRALTDACDQALDDIPGFCWLTHTVDYANYPASLRVICVFDTDEALAQAYNGDDVATLRNIIEKALREIDVPLRTPSRQIRFDTEQTCEREHGGNWSARLSKR